MARIEIDKMSSYCKCILLWEVITARGSFSCIERSVRWWSDTFQFREKGKVL